MSNRRSPYPVSAVVLAVAVGAAGCDDTVFNNGSAGGGSFEEIAASSCEGCHSGGAAAGSLDLSVDPCVAVVDVPATNYDGLLVAPGDPDASVLFQKMIDSGEYGGVMPTTGVLDDDSLDVVYAWILDGAPCS